MKVLLADDAFTITLEPLLFPESVPVVTLANGFTFTAWSGLTFGEWNHFAIVYDVANLETPLIFYINGEAVENTFSQREPLLQSSCFLEFVADSLTNFKC